jgi:zinc transport system permease protein
MEGRSVEKWKDRGAGRKLLMLFSAFGYAPIVRGFVALLLAGSLFPLVGIFVLRLNLVPLRFALMHGTLLGGAIALALDINPLFMGLVINMLLILAIGPLARYTGLNTGSVTTLFMVLTIGLAFAVIYRASVPAKDAFSILWGNLYTLSWLEVLVTVLFSVGILIFVLFLFQSLKALLFNREIAFSAGIREGLLFNAVLILSGATVAFGMRLIGALLLDSILLLPALVSSWPPSSACLRASADFFSPWESIFRPARRSRSFRLPFWV